MFFLLLFVLLISDLMSHCLIQGAKDLLPLFFFSLSVLSSWLLTLRSPMHFESVFMCGVREGSSFIPSLVDTLVPAPFVAKTVLPLLKLSSYPRLLCF